MRTPSRSISALVLVLFTVLSASPARAVSPDGVCEVLQQQEVTLQSRAVEIQTQRAELAKLEADLKKREKRTEVGGYVAISFMTAGAIGMLFSPVFAKGDIAKEWGLRGLGTATLIASGLLLNISSEKLEGFRNVVKRTREMIEIQFNNLQTDLSNIQEKKREYSCS